MQESQELYQRTGKNCSASQSQWERTSCHRFVEKFREKNPEVDGVCQCKVCPKVVVSVPQWHMACAFWFSSTRPFSRDWAGKCLPELELVLKKEWENKKRCLLQDRSAFAHKEGLTKKSDGLLFHAIDSVVAMETASNPRWVKHCKMQRCVFAILFSFTTSSRTKEGCVQSQRNIVHSKKKHRPLTVPLIRERSWKVY